MCYDRAGGNDSVGPDAHSGQDRRGSSDPDVRTDGDRSCRDVLASAGWLNWVTSCHQIDPVGDHRVVSDVDRRGSGERTVVADEHCPADS